MQQELFYSKNEKEKVNSNKSKEVLYIAGMASNEKELVNCEQANKFTVNKSTSGLPTHITTHRDSKLRK